MYPKPVVLSQSIWQGVAVTEWGYEGDPSDEESPDFDLDLVPNPDSLPPADQEIPF